MSGMRALEVGTWDGFWAFEMERRGAEVVALDLDDEQRSRLAAAPAPEGVVARTAAATAFASRRRSWAPRSSGSTAASTTPTPEELGTFDLVFCGIGPASTCATSCWRSSGSRTSARASSSPPRSTTA